MDLTDDSMKGTPNRVAKMFVKEIFGGLNPDKKPKASTFENNYKYGEMLVEKNITRLLYLRTPFITNHWKSTRCLHFERKSYWSFKNEPYCRILSPKDLKFKNA